MNFENQKLEVSYPTNWEYKIMVFSHVDINELLFDLVDKKCKIKKSTQSRTKKFTSHSVEINVTCEDERKELFKKFEQHKEVKYIL
jgi:putative lipoic acid-binding regulatory protein